MKQLFRYDCTKLQEPAAPVSTAILWCVERRIRGLRGKFAAAMGIEEHIPIIVPGGIKTVVLPRLPRDGESVMEWIDFLQDKLGFEKLYAMAHLNCAACESNGDSTYYENLLLEGGDILRKRLPHIEIVTIFADCTGVHLVESESLAVA
jgi:hypothetical protein